MPINVQDYLSPDSGEFAGHRILNAETGWPEVKRGLGLIFIAHISGFFLALAVLNLFTFMDALVKPLQAGTGKGEAQWGTAAYILAWFIVGVLAFITEVALLVGIWKCLWAPERHWAKPLIFASLTCIVMSQLLWLVSWLYGGRFDLAYQVLALISLVLFVLFLRAVACCFDNAVRAWSINLFFVLIALIVGGIFYLKYSIQDWNEFAESLKQSISDGRMAWPTELKLILGISFGILLACVWYLCLVWSARGSVARGLRQRRSPLDPVD